MSRLTRYVLSQWLRVFLLTAVGLPFVSILTQLTDNLRRLLDASLSPGTIALSYVYALPQNIAQMMPAACLFAAVFTVGPLARHSEITAAKAGGISFHRVIRPILLVSALAAVAAFFVGELATETTTRQLELQGQRQNRLAQNRYTFVFRSPSGWVYTVRSLSTAGNLMQQVVLERAVRGERGERGDRATPLYAITADSARWDPGRRQWKFLNGASHVLTPSGEDASRAELGYQHVEFRQGRIEDLPVEDGWADVAISNGVINLSFRKAKVITETFRVLKPGGRISIVDVVSARPLSPSIVQDPKLWAS